MFKICYTLRQINGDDDDDDEEKRQKTLIELSLFMTSSVFVKKCLNNTYMQCSNARLLVCDISSGYFSE